MKKYTIVYTVLVGCGNMRKTVVQFDRIETDDLSKFISGEKYDGVVSIIFEGWPKQEGE